MPRNGSGVSSVINTFVIDTVADPDEVNANFTDVADQLTNSLPRDGQAGMNAPLPLQNGTTALPALTFTSDTNTGIYRKAADSVGVSGNGVEIAAFSPTGLAVATALTVAGVAIVGTVYASKSGNYTAVAADNGAVHRYTATATVSLTAAATLGSSWRYTVIAYGAVVTIDPNGSETIDGATTLSVPSGSSAEIICDGTNFFSVVKTGITSAKAQPGYYTLPDGTIVQYGNTSGTTNASGNATITFPVTFPNNKRSFIVSWGDAGTGNHIAQALDPGGSILGSNNILVRVANTGAAAASVGYRVDWLAIGD